MMTPFDDYAGRALRSEEVSEAGADAIAQCRRAPRRESLAALAGSFGFDRFSYIVLGPSAAQPRVVEHWTSCSTAWTARYAARGYHLVDPRVTLTRHRSVPIAWDASIGEREPRMCEFLQDAARHDVRGGIAWSSHDARIGRAVVAWDSRQADATPVGLRLGTIALLAGIVHEALAAHCTTAAPRHEKATLTERERECLALVARGMTSADVGTKLGITARTANFHIGNVMAKLGAVSRGEAIARAVADQLVSID
jgi:DNA-binding CsgD family transcriptional regulator